MMTIIWLVIKFGLYSSTIVNKWVIFSRFGCQTNWYREQRHRRLYIIEHSVRLERDHQVLVVIRLCLGQLIYNILASLFYMPGTLGGAFVVDYLGPKNTMVHPFSDCFCQFVHFVICRSLVSYAKQCLALSWAALTSRTFILISTAFIIALMSISDCLSTLRRSLLFTVFSSVSESWVQCSTN